MTILYFHRSRWTCDLRRRSATDHLLGLWVRILPTVCVPVVNVFYFQVDASETGWFLVQRRANRVCITACDKVQQQPFTPAMNRSCYSKPLLHFLSYIFFTNYCLIKSKGNCTLNRSNLFRKTNDVPYKMISVPNHYLGICHSHTAPSCHAR